MQTVWIKSGDKPTSTEQRGVIVFALGWAGSDELVRHLTIPGGYDMLCLFDYRTLPSDVEKTEWYTQLQAYSTRHLMAWSFGVWAANTLFATPIPHNPSTPFWRSATAINGTPIPVSDSYGLPVRAFALTMRNIIGAGMFKFLERMCDTPETLQFYYHHRSTRHLDEIYEELQKLQEQSKSSTESLPDTSFWTRAIIGEKDAIFPPENMERYWTEAQTPSILMKYMPHYPFHDNELLTKIITLNATR